MDARLRRFLSPPAAGVSLLPPVPRRALLALAGLGCGLSPAFYGYFDLSVWGPLTLGLVVAAIGLLFAHQAVPTGIRAVAVVGLLAFACWCLISIGWAESGDRALTEGDRWILYGLYLLVLVLLVADRVDAEVLLAATAAGVVGVAAYDVLRLLGSDNQELFSGTRLLEPLGYVNGLGGFFLLGFWPLAAVAERVRQPLLAGVAAGAAALLASLVVLTDSRGTLFAFAASALLLLVLLPGRNRRAWLLLLVIVGVALAWGPLTDVTQALRSPIANPPVETIQHGVRVALLASAGVAVAWALAVWLVGVAFARSGKSATSASRASAAALAAIVLVAVVGAAATVDDPVGKVSDQYESFTELEPTVNGASRFTSGGGNRYDYWRIAWHQFTDHPLDGLGAGNYDRTYFLERQTDEDVRQAHSIELQTLGETGLIGALLLGAFFVAVFIGAWRRAAAARARPAEIGATVTALGMFTVWLAQTSVDWLHLIPGLTGIALGAAAILLRRDPGDGDGETARSGLRPVPAIALGGAVLLGALAILFVGRATLAEHLRSNARSELTAQPAEALTSASESLSLNGDSPQGYYLEAAALARLGDYQAAKRALREAIEREPHNYVSWALLGDLLTRRGAIEPALRAYGQAAALNPRDRSLKLLKSNRNLVARLHQHPERASALIEAATQKSPAPAG
jgi:O-Antigen ligase/Tetratricopeptide repeat